MKTFLMVLALSGFWGVAFAQNAVDPKIQNVISDQIDAFQSDDFTRAYSYASPIIQKIFGDPDNFGRMVRQGFPMVWRPASIRFLEQTPSVGRVYQNILVTDADGVFHVLEYEMVMAGEAWQINGVRIVPAPEVGA